MKTNPDYKSRFRILKGGKVSLVVSALLGSITLSFASPSGGVVTSGTANISQSGTVTNINQSTQNATINWQSFSIASNETVNFNQPNASSITLNRIIGNEKSIINGALNANGQVWLLNSNGILFGKNASINTAGLLATTAQLSDNDFNAGNYKFKNASEASVINEGTIEIANNGSVILASNEVRNSGTIKAVKGKIHLVGAQEYSINLNGNSLVELTVDKGVLDALVENSGTILADGGEIYLTTNAVNELLDGMVNNTGVIEANSIDGITGYVELFAHGGTANVDGTLSAEGGFIETSGEKLSIKDTINIKAKDWLLDPTNITIVSSGTEPISGTPTATTTTPGDVTISANTIETVLNGGTNVSLQADNDINVNEDISWTSNTLTLDAGNDINVNAVMSATATAGIALKYTGDLTTAKTNTGTFTGKINVASTGSVNINNNPYTIISDSANFANISTGLSGKYVIGNDIDFTAANLSALRTKAFAGTLDGFGHVISNLTLTGSTTGPIGLFDSTNTGALIQNLGLASGSIDVKDSNAGAITGIARGTTIYNVFSAVNLTSSQTGSKYSMGGLVGLANVGSANTVIKDSYSSGNVKGVGSISKVGGLVGSTEDSSTYDIRIENSFATGDIEGASQVGGLVGSFFDGVIQDSYATGKVTYNAIHYIGSDGNSFGGLVGDVTTGTSVVINRSYATGAVTSDAGSNYTTDHIGGLVGWANSSGSGTITIENSYATGNVKAANSYNAASNGAGGLVGGMQGVNTIIKDSYATTGSVTGYNRVGGLVGLINSGSVNNSYASRSVTGAKINVGGLVGWNSGTISNSYATGAVSGDQYIGGLVGENPGTINNSYATGAANSPAGAYVGGLVAKNTGTITNSYSAGAVTTSNSSNRGGLVQQNTGTVSNSFWDTTTSGITTSAGGTGLATADMQKFSTFSGAGWTIALDATLPPNNYPILVTNNGVTSWKIYGTFIPVSYTLSNILTGYTYNGNSQLPSIWSASDIFGATYASWVLGTDYYFVYNSSSDVTGFTNAGTYNGITVNIVKSGYDETASGSTNGSFVIGTKDITAITGITASNKVYNRTTAATLDTSAASFTGMISGDTLNVATSTGTFDNWNVGTGKTVSISGLTLGGEKAGNYNLTNATATTTANITAKPLTFTSIGAVTTTYGTSAATGAVTFSGVETEDTVTALANVFSPTYSTSGNLKAGTYSQYATLGGANAGNYSIIGSQTNSYVVNQLAIAGSIANSSSIYGDDPTTAYNSVLFSNVVSEDVINMESRGLANSTAVGDFATTNGAVKFDAGSYKVFLGSLTGADLANYSVNDGFNYYITGDHTITKKSLNVSGITADNKVYNRDATASLSGTEALTNGASSNADGLYYTGDTVSLTGTASGTFADWNVGTGKTVTVSGLSLAGTSANNYSLNPVTTTANITPKTLTISGLTSANKVYDGTTAATVGGAAALQAFETVGTGTTSDGKAYTGDTVSLTGTAVGNFNDKDVADATTVSFSGLSLTGVQAGNYTLANHANATHTISKKDITADTITANNKVYDGTTSATLSTFTSSGFIGADIVSFTSTNTFGDANVGTGKPVTVGTIALAGADAGNYNLTSTSETTTANITPTPVESTTTVKPPVVQISTPPNISNETEPIKPPVVQKSTPPKFTPNNFVVSQKAEKTPIVSQPIAGEKTKKVTQTEVQAMQNSETTLVPVGKGALLQLVNSGVTLPEGVEQEFYVVEDNRR